MDINNAVNLNKAYVRSTKIDTFSDQRRAELDKDIAEGKSDAFLRKKYEISYPAIKNYRNRLDAAVLKPQNAAPIQQRVDNLTAEITAILDACKKLLTVNGVYDFSPRADELEVIVNDGNGHRKENLHNLLSELEAYSGMHVVRWQYMREDPRNLLLRCAKLMQEQLELCGRLTGAIKDIQVNVDVQGVVLPQIVAIINDVLKDTPDLKDQIAKRLMVEVTA